MLFDLDCQLVVKKDKSADKGKSPKEEDTRDDSHSKWQPSERIPGLPDEVDQFLDTAKHRPHGLLRKIVRRLLCRPRGPYSPRPRICTTCEAGQERSASQEQASHRQEHERGFGSSWCRDDLHLWNPAVPPCLDVQVSAASRVHKQQAWRFVNHWGVREGFVRAPSRARQPG